MRLPRIFVDTSVLILIFQNKDPELRLRAIAQLDRDAEFLSSKIIDLELLPRPIVNNRTLQVKKFREFLAATTRVECSDSVQDLAMQEAVKPPGLDMGDALHVACAIAGGADELICAESPTNTLPQAKGITVRTIAL